VIDRQCRCRGSALKEQHVLVDCEQARCDNFGAQHMPVAKAPIVRYRTSIGTPLPRLGTN
jgi:hypothetical protein